MSLQIIGAGFGRTGTESLRAALQMLGYPCHHMQALREETPEMVPAWTRVICEGEAPDWDRLFNGYTAQLDWPGVHYWRALVGHYPNAKVILTVRDAANWYKSISETILPFLKLKGQHVPDHRNDIATIVETIFAQCFGTAFPDEATASAVFERHNAEVMDAVPPERLLVLPVGAGWEPLCAFLDLPVPDVPYPSGNSSADFQDRIAANLKES